MKKVKMDLNQLSKSIKSLDNKSMSTIKGGLASGDPPPFAVLW